MSAAGSRVVYSSSDHRLRLELSDVCAELVSAFNAPGDLLADHVCTGRSDAPGVTTMGYPGWLGYSAPAEPTLRDSWTGARLLDDRGYDAALGYTWPIPDPRPRRCGHADIAGVPLLQRVAWLVEPGAAPAREVKVRTPPGARHGSPAPWAARPAELLDEVLQGAHAANALARSCLDLAPLEVPYLLTRNGARRVKYYDARMDGWAGAARALLDLPRLVDALSEHGARTVYRDDLGYDDPPRVTGYRQLPDTARSVARELDVRIRRWHRAALVVTGHEQPWPAVREMRNLDNVATYDLGPTSRVVVGPRLHGPVCAASVDSPRQRPACEHPSCQQAFDHGLLPCAGPREPLTVRYRVGIVYRPELEPHRFAVGAVCATRECRHESCRALRVAWARKWVQARCPWCGSASLRLDPVHGAVHCMRPSCRDDQGNRRVWSADELRRLGLMIGAPS